MAPKYVLLQGYTGDFIGSCFFTMNVPGDDPTKLKDGTIAYSILGYAETVKEAQIKLYGRAYTTSDD